MPTQIDAHIQRWRRLKRIKIARHFESTLSLSLESRVNGYVKIMMMIAQDKRAGENWKQFLTLSVRFTKLQKRGSTRRGMSGNKSLKKGLFSGWYQAAMLYMTFHPWNELCLISPILTMGAIDACTSSNWVNPFLSRRRGVHHCFWIASI